MANKEEKRWQKIEQWVAAYTGGELTKGSGNVHADSDVISDDAVYEVKYIGYPKLTYTVEEKYLERVYENAVVRGKIPYLVLYFEKKKTAYFFRVIYNSYARFYSKGDKIYISLQRDDMNIDKIMHLKFPYVLVKEKAVYYNIDTGECYVKEETDGIFESLSCA